MTPRLSIVIPTRHRPHYVREALHYASMQAGDYEIVVADNYVDPKLSVRTIVDELGASEIRYVRPERPLGMVDNWNFALSEARGDYVLYFTDKTFLLPHVVSRLVRFLDCNEPDIVNWTSDGFAPLHYEEPFSSGVYTSTRSGGEIVAEQYEPLAALSAKGRGTNHRSLMSAVDYARGKICFGAYRRELIDRVQAKYGSLFKPISPDYTSMILGLSEASFAVDLGWSGSVQVNTDISNGMLCATNDEAARRFLDEIGALAPVMTSGLAPGVYASVSANVAFDYINMKKSFGLSFDFDRTNWLVQSYMDLHAAGRKWSSTEIQLDQINRLNGAIDALPRLERAQFENALSSLLRTRDPGRMVRLRGHAHRRIGDLLARYQFGRVLRAIASSGMMSSFHSCSLRDAVFATAGDRS